MGVQWIRGAGMRVCVGVQGAKGGGMEVLGRLFLANEEFRGRVRRHHITTEIQAVSHPWNL